MKPVLYFLLLILHGILKYLRATWVRACYRASGSRVAADSTLRIGHRGRLDLAPQTSIGIGCLLIVESEQQADTDSSLQIGHGTAINEYCNLRASGCNIVIGKKCLFGQFVSIIGSNHGMAPGVPMADQPWDTQKTGVLIGDDVWIGAHAVVLPGVTIGQGAVIAAGAVVNKNIPAYEIWAGIPARRVSSRIKTACTASSKAVPAC